MVTTILSPTFQLPATVAYSPAVTPSIALPFTSIFAPLLHAGMRMRKVTALFGAAVMEIVEVSSSG